MNAPVAPRIRNQRRTARSAKYETHLTIEYDPATHLFAVTLTSFNLESGVTTKALDALLGTWKVTHFMAAARREP